ncbi:MAG TPA: uroporphyrinogen decarboxylase family protein [Planctomycetota bacterium]|nr:uroporphyrinogen decarboxylase family protein [Planctomycetota bacterium]
MTSRERVRRALRFEKPDRAPRTLWALPGVCSFRKAEYQAMLERFPGDLGDPPCKYGKSGRARGDCLTTGEYVDEWGVVWTNGEAGIVGEIKHPILADDAALAAYQLPWELLDGADLSRVDEFCAKSEKFIKPGTTCRPFERLQFLRGTEQLYVDLAYGTPAVLKLLGQLHEFYVREFEMWAKTAVDGVSFMDDWGSQNALLISPDMWREIFKPLYAEYCRILRKAGKFVFFHSDGNISAIYPDLIEIGVDAVNSQLFCMDIEVLARLHRGKITLWGEIDRQHLLPFGTPEEVKEGVRRVRRAFDDGRGGLIAQCEWGIKDPAENIAAVFEAWDEPLAAVKTEKTCASQSA